MIKAAAPNTPVLFFSYAAYLSRDWANAQADVNYISSHTTVGWTKFVVGWHGYQFSGSGTDVNQNTSDEMNWLNGAKAAGISTWDSEFTAVYNTPSCGNFNTQYMWSGTAAIKNVLLPCRVPFTDFVYLDEYETCGGLSAPQGWRQSIDNAGITWTPDFGTWP